jgi:hypothetical protein
VRSAVQLCPGPQTPLELHRDPSRGKGAVAQSGERWLCKPEVVGSIPIGSTKKTSAGARPAVIIENRIRRSFFRPLLVAKSECARWERGRPCRPAEGHLIGVPRKSNPARELDACLRDKVKLRRAYGGCLGSQRRRRTWTAAISSGEPLTGRDPEISEWGNPRGVKPQA